MPSTPASPPSALRSPVSAGAPAPAADFRRSTQLDFLLALFRPWITKSEAAFLLDDCSEDYILALVDSGTLRAVNIASAEDTRREVRIYRYTVERRIIAPAHPAGRVPVDAIIPHHRPTILCRELSDWLGCTERHVRNLALAGPRDRHDTRHRIYREAVVEFIESREIL